MQKQPLIFTLRVLISYWQNIPPNIITDPQSYPMDNNSNPWNDSKSTKDKPRATLNVPGEVSNKTIGSHSGMWSQSHYCSI